jgi:hypothetical protein
MYILSLLLFMWCCMTVTVSPNVLQELKKENPFAYDLGVKILPSKHKNAQVMICCHGYGHNNQIGDVVHTSHVVPYHVVSFNFPDHDITDDVDHAKSSFGTIKEILPLLYILKRCVVDLSLSCINLYGFSAGGGAIVNMLVVLNQANYDTDLQKMGIGPHEKQRILQAIERGLIILDCPLKSMQEIIDLRGNSKSFEVLAAQFKKNNMNPIDSVNKLVGLHLNVLLHFQQPDEILGNRDDKLFIERLRQANKGTTTVVIGHEGGHNTFHTSLWKAFKKMKK